jgi:WD40 repeat protein
MGAVFSNKPTVKEASLDDDAPRECDTTPVIPINLISHLVLPFVQDRPTWNAVCSANKELQEASMKMTPPWPATKLELGQSVGPLKFSPCGSVLAAGAYSYPYLVHICDRRGRQTCLRGHTSEILCLSFSNDGNYLASAGMHEADTSIRIWPTHPTSRFPQQSDKTLRGHQCVITCLDFSPSDSHILASGDAGSNIKLWNVEQEVCIYSFDHGCGYIPSLYFPAAQDEDQQCIFVARAGSLIRTHWGADFSGSIESDIVDMPGLGDSVQTSAFSHCGSLLAATSYSNHTVTLYNMITLTVVRRLPLPRNMSLGTWNSLAFSPDGKTLVLRYTSEIHICEVPYLNIMRRLLPDVVSAHTSDGTVAFDPSGQSLASADGDQNLRLWTL